MLRRTYTGNCPTDLADLTDPTITTEARYARSCDSGGDGAGSNGRSIVLFRYEARRQKYFLAAFLQRAQNEKKMRPITTVI